MATTVASLILQAKNRADMVNSNFVKEDEWIRYIDNAWKELYDILVSKFEDYYTVSSTFSVASGSSSYTLPTDFYKLRGVDRSSGGSDYFALKMFNFEDRNKRGVYTRYRGIEPMVKYRIMKDSLIFSPEDQAAGNYRLWYIPKAPDLTLTTDTIDGVNGWEDYVFNAAAMKALAKEESDVSVVMAELAEINKRIEAMAQNRDTSQTERVTDVASGGYYDPLFLG